MKINFFFAILLNYLVVLNSYTFSENEVFIEIKIENEIITNIDINYEKNYLIALNNKLENLNNDQLYNLAKDSLAREKIKKVELEKTFDLKKNDNLTNVLIKNLYKNLNLNNIKEFENYLDAYNLKIKDIREKILIERLWNKLIFEKFNKNLIINKENLKKQLEDQVKKNKLEEFNLKEIMFELKVNEKLEQKSKHILDFIKKNGFENAANIFSISDSAKFGGSLGWINKAQISKNILNEINDAQIGEITKPIQVNSTYLILKLENKRKKEVKINIEKELEKLIIYEKEKQLNNYSLMFFNKVKKNIYINES